jgi:hypothetical protein
MRKIINTVMNQDYDRLKNNIIAQANYFLKKAGEFYPFGAAINKNYDLSPIGIYFGEEFPSSLDVLTHLEEVIKKGIQNAEYLSAAVCVDIHINVEQQKQNALEIRFYATNFFQKKYFLYTQLNHEYQFQEYAF